MPFFAIMSNGHDFFGHEADTVEEALFAHVTDGGCPEPSTDPVRDNYGFWFTGMLRVWEVHNPALVQALIEEVLTSLECEGEGDFVSGKDFTLVGTWRWNDDPFGIADENADLAEDGGLGGPPD